VIPRPAEGVWATPAEELVGAPVADGVWLTSLPFPTPLKFSFSYLVETVGGLVVVDLGWNTDQSWQRFQAGLTRAGKTLDDVSGVVVTHVHPDHYGLATRIRDTTAAWIAVHPGERAQLAVDQAAALQRIDDMVTWLRVCGAPDSEVESLRADTADLAANFPSVLPDVDLADRTPVRGTDGSLVPLHTPGHTPGHTCFHDRERNLVFTGDHVLPRVTPNVSKRPTSDEDPLADYISSLRLVDALDADGALFALPGHEWGFAGVGGRAVEIEVHHTARLTELEAAVRTGCSTVWEVAQVISWSRPFEDLTPRARRSAIGETYSHLYRLRETGALRLTDGVPERWAPAASQISAARGTQRKTYTRRLPR
jgi:glyoxylase-like metal-dependent hydrolase (beta-lactamase superfamily II)